MKEHIPYREREHRKRKPGYLKNNTGLLRPEDYPTAKAYKDAVVRKKSALSHKPRNAHEQIVFDIKKQVERKHNGHK